jgi:hypothetical protein
VLLALHARARALSERPSARVAQVRAALEALRNKRRERELVGFYSMPAVGRLQQPPSATSDQLAALRERHQHDMTALRTRLNTRLSKASAYTRHCDRAIRLRDAAMATLHEELSRMRVEVADLVKMAAASASDPKQASVKFVALGECAKVLQSSVSSSLEHLNKQRVRAVDVSWSGMAEDVRVMGSFDGWTHGVPLSPHETRAYTLFTASLQLLPGSYEIKFLVDSQWRLAADWPHTGEGDSANNLLVVGEDDAGERDGAQ